MRRGRRPAPAGRRVGGARRSSAPGLLLPWGESRPPPSELWELRRQALLWPCFLQAEPPHSPEPRVNAGAHSAGAAPPPPAERRPPVGVRRCALGNLWRHGARSLALFQPLGVASGLGAEPWVALKGLSVPWPLAKVHSHHELLPSPTLGLGGEETNGRLDLIHDTLNPDLTELAL